uniref:Uncharacterized protein n=1 Tax=Fagus sylvatica TaxID=28930 RepID=A0A2N9I0D5_FAGSY
MESKFLLMDEAKVAISSLDRRHDHKETSKPSTSCSCSSCSSSTRGSKCCDKTTECLCSACVLCVCCPVAVLWGCIKLPCKLGWRAAKHAKRWACCGSEMKGFADYSSFSDNDISETLPSNTRTCSKTMSGPRKRVIQRANGLEFNK